MCILRMHKRIYYARTLNTNTNVQRMNFFLVHISKFTLYFDLDWMDSKNLEHNFISLYIVDFFAKNLAL